MKKFILNLVFLAMTLCASGRTYHYYGLMDGNGNITEAEDYNARIRTEINGSTLYYTICDNYNNWVNGPYLTLMNTDPLYFYAVMGPAGYPFQGAITMTFSEDFDALLLGIWGSTGGMYYIED